MQQLPKRQYNRDEIVAILKAILAEIGETRFSAIGVMEVEKLVRSRNTPSRLPGKTLLRRVINEFRGARWPKRAPKALGRRM